MAANAIIEGRQPWRQNPFKQDLGIGYKTERRDHSGAELATVKTRCNNLAGGSLARQNIVAVIIAAQ
jgi:hypothetical protein